MKKFFVSIAIVILAVAGQGCATGGSLPYVVASNAALPYQIMAAGQVGSAYGQSFYGVPGYGQMMFPVCRPQEVAGLSPVSQPVLVRVPKSRGHQARDIIYGTLVGGGLGMIAGGGQKIQIGRYLVDAGTLAGAGIGAGGAGLWTNHESDLCLYLPAPAP